MLNKKSLVELLEGGRARPTFPNRLEISWEYLCPFRYISVEPHPELLSSSGRAGGSEPVCSEDWGVFKLVLVLSTAFPDGRVVRLLLDIDIEVAGETSKASKSCNDNSICALLPSPYRVVLICNFCSTNSRNGKWCVLKADDDDEEEEEEEEEDG